MKTPMGVLLDKILAESTQDAVAIQLTFKPGVQTSSGALKRGPVDGIYCLGIISLATEHTPGKNKGDQLMVEQYFEAEAVQSIVKQLDVSNIVIPDHLINA